jgi:TATA-box binding protein (TBP) (component of TFIID and TFIIIB)
MAKTMTMTIDDEWKNFISPDYEEGLSDDVDIDIEENNEIISNLGVEFTQAPKATDIYISTKSKIAYLNKEINLKEVFWNVPVLPYAKPLNGVIKKQMKFNSLCQEELDIITENLKKESYFEEQIITSINNPNGRIKFKDIRKVSIGISKKDIMSYRCKKKSAFYNCFVMIMRLKINNVFKEFHIKVFNTGKLEIPGIQNDNIFEEVLKNIIQNLQPHVKDKLEYLQTSDTVLINSNFNCGFYINREVLFDILKFKYNIHCIYDPCSYPGIQCKFYYNPQLTVQTGSQISQEDKDNKKYNKIIEVSFMIFRTGSILIVGMCNEDVLYSIYEFLKILLQTEFQKINQKIITSENRIVKDKKKKIRRKVIQINIDTV